MPVPLAMRPPTTDAAPPALCLSIHDVAPSTWPACARLLAAVESVATVPVTLLVVPHYHRRDDGGAAFRRTLEQRLARGDELALHGYFHLDDGPPPRHWRERLLRTGYTAGEGEFSAMGAQAVRERLEAGRAWFAQRDWPLSGFVAPAWLMNAPTWAYLRGSGLRYTTTLRAFHRLEDGARVRAQSLVYSVRGRWRRDLSRLWNTALLQRQRRAPLLRLSLHPADARYPEVVRHWQRLLARALTEGRVAMTKADFCRTWPRAANRE